MLFNCSPQTSAISNIWNLLEIQFLRHPLTELESCGEGRIASWVLNELSRWFTCTIKLENLEILCSVKPGVLSIPLEGALSYIFSKLEQRMTVDYGRDSPAFLLRYVYIWEHLHGCTQSSFSWPFHKYSLNTLLCRYSSVHRDATVDKSIMEVKFHWMGWSISKYSILWSANKCKEEK